MLVSAALVIVLVLIATQRYYREFPLAGQVLAWAVVIGSIVALASLGASLLRLYVEPAVANGLQKGRARRAHRSRKRRAP